MRAIENENNNQNNTFDDIMKKVKKVGLSILRKVIIISLPVILFLITLSAFTWFILKDEGTWEEEEKGNPSTYTNNVKLSTTEGITADKLEIVKKGLLAKGYTQSRIDSMTETEMIEILGMNNKLGENVTSINDCSIAEILWCINNDYSKYLKKPEDLEYLLNAEVVTQYPKLDGIASDKLNGVIQFARATSLEDANSDGLINFDDGPIMLTYTSSEEFETKFQNYINSGDRDVFNYYTLDDEGNAVVATWSEEEGSFESNNTAVQNRKKINQGLTEETIKNEYNSKYTVTANTQDLITASYTFYNASKTTINYKSNISQYTLPFNYLWALLVMGESDEFVLNLASLAYNSQIIIGIYDSTTTTVTTNTKNYTENFRERYEERNTSDNKLINSEDWTNPPTSYSYYEKNTVTVTNNTIQKDIMYANTWIVEVRADYKRNQTQDTYAPEETTIEDEDWSDNGVTSQTETKNEIKIDSQGNRVPYSYSVVKIQYKEKKLTGQTQQTQQDVSYDKYEKVKTDIKEKTDIDPNSDQNFVKLLRADDNARTMLFTPINVIWLCDILSANSDTANMVELTQYLINKAKNPDDTSLTFDFSIFEPSSLNNVSINSNKLKELLKSYENDALRKYMNGELGDYVNVETYVTQDKSKYKMYYTSVDGCLNFSYGIMVRNKKGQLNNAQYFAEEGIDLQTLVNNYENGQEVTIDVEIIERIFDKIINDKKQLIKDMMSEKGADLKNYELDALVNVAYQYGNCGQYISGENNIANLYNNLYQAGKVQEFKEKAQAETAGGSYVHFFDDSSSRKQKNWLLFTEGRYILNDGTELVGGSNVAEFALQFVGQNHAIFTSYTSSTGVNFIEADWCAMFVSYCYDNCGLIPDVLNEVYFGCTTEVRNLKSRGEFIDKSTGYIPESGDIIFFTDNNGITSYHTGIVTSCDGSRVYTVEGNTGYSEGATNWSNSWVATASYSINSSLIYGYFSINK